MRLEVTSPRCDTIESLTTRQENNPSGGLASSRRSQPIPVQAALQRPIRTQLSPEMRSAHAHITGTADIMSKSELIPKNIVVVNRNLSAYEETIESFTTRISNLRITVGDRLTDDRPVDNKMAICAMLEQFRIDGLDRETTNEREANVKVTDKEKAKDSDAAAKDDKVTREVVLNVKNSVTVTDKVKTSVEIVVNEVDNDLRAVKGVKDKDKDVEDKVEAAEKDGELCSRGPTKPVRCTTTSEPYSVPRNHNCSSGGSVLRYSEPPRPSHESPPFNFNIPLGPEYTCQTNDALIEELDALGAELDTLIYMPDFHVDEPIENVIAAVFERPEFQTEEFNRALNEASAGSLLDSPPATPESALSMFRATDATIPAPVDEISSAGYATYATWQTSIPSVGDSSSGYNSSSPRRSVDTPSPPTSLRGSHDNIPRLNKLRLNSDSTSASPTYQIKTPPYFSEPGTEQSYSYNVGTSQEDRFAFEEVFNDFGSCDNYGDAPKQAVDYVTPRHVEEEYWTGACSNGLKGQIMIQPKPSTVPEGAKARMLARMNPEKKQMIWGNIAAENDEDLSRMDKDGDTQLMILIMQDSGKTPFKLEYVYTMVERLKTIPGALTSVNLANQSALYLAALFCSDPDAALMTRYIAETLVEMQVDIDQVDEGGNTLLHLLCMEGDQRCRVIAELISIRGANSKKCFNINKYNYKGLTPLLVAVSCHQSGPASSGQGQASPGLVSCTKIVRLLISAGADTMLKVQDPCKSTALELAIDTSCDPNLIEALLTSEPLAATVPHAVYGSDTVLHRVARRNELPASRQGKVYAMLERWGARRDARNADGRVPSELKDADRR